VLIASRDGRVVASVHAGWRGIVGGVCLGAIEAMRALGASDLLAAVGPCIGPENFEVGPEVVAEFARVFAAHERDLIRPIASGKALIDLKRALDIQLRSVGVRDVDVLPHCTVRDERDFFSHRAHKGRTGRMIGIIGPRSQ
jgi:YfiH family protein